MDMLRLLMCVSMLAGMAACVAPEAPPAPRVEAVHPAVSTAGFEDAPTPNRKLGAPGSDSVIRIAH